MLLDSFGGDFNSIIGSYKYPTPLLSLNRELWSASERTMLIELAVSQCQLLTKTF